jgi:hypothetical protein
VVRVARFGRVRRVVHCTAIEYRAHNDRRLCCAHNDQVAKCMPPSLCFIAQAHMNQVGVLEIYGALRPLNTRSVGARPSRDDKKKRFHSQKKGCAIFIVL